MTPVPLRAQLGHASEPARHMHVVHGVGWYFPDGVGGTERYLSGLCSALATRGIESTVVAPGTADSTYVHSGVVVHRFAVDETPTRRAMRSDAAASKFASILAASRGVVYHQHSVTRGLDGGCLAVARDLGMRTVHTMHTATPVCLRGTLVRPGDEVCDGLIDADRCARCWLEARGRSPAWSMVPAAVGRWALASAPGTRLATALSTRSTVVAHRDRLAAMIGNSDRTIVGSRWHRDVLVRNGANPDVLRVVEPGLDEAFVVDGGVRPEGAAKVLFVGRVEPMKGLHLLIAAMRQVAGAELVVLAALPPGNSPHLDYAREQLALATASGATVLESQSQQEVAQWMARSDIVAIPSQVLETGPLVALEAMAAGAWIVASDLGGLSERVHGRAGALVAAASMPAWVDALRNAVEHAPARRSARAPQAVRRADDVAADMAAIYGELE